MADAGARRIHDLLVTDEGDLADALEEIGKGLRAADADGEVGPSVVDGIKAARLAYGGTLAGIRRIQTSSAAKGDAIDAILRLSDGLRLFGKGIEAGSLTDEGRARIDAAATQMHDAAADLSTATDALMT